MNLFTPDTANLNRLHGAVLDAAEDGMDPLYMLDYMGIPYHVMLPDGRDHEVMPWPEIEGYLVVANAEHAAQWMHPLLRARLGSLTEDEIYAAIKGKNSRSGGIDLFIARDMHKNCGQRLARLDAELSKTAPAMQALSALAMAPGAGILQDRINEVIASHGIDPDVAWRLARVAFKIPPGTSSDGFSASAPLDRAEILAQRIDIRRAAAPKRNALRQALVRLQIVPHSSAHQRLQAARDCALVAHGIAHSMLPCRPRDLRSHPVFAADLLRTRIAGGLIDPELRDRGAVVLVEMIGGIMAETGALSSHYALPLVQQANDRLATLGLPANVSAKACSEIAVAGDAIPF